MGKKWCITDIITIGFSYFVAMAITQQLFTTSDSSCQTSSCSEYCSYQQILLHEIISPDIVGTVDIHRQTCQVFPCPCTYNIIIGSDFTCKKSSRLVFTATLWFAWTFLFPYATLFFFTLNICVHGMILGCCWLWFLASIIKNMNESNDISPIHLSSEEYTAISTM